MPKIHILRPVRQITFCGIFDRPTPVILVEDLAEHLHSPTLCQKCKSLALKDGWGQKAMGPKEIEVS